MSEGKIESVQTFGRKKTATALAFVKRGKGLIKVNGIPISLLQPEILKMKTFEPVLLLGADKFANVDIRVRVRGGGTTSQIYATRPLTSQRLSCYPAALCSPTVGATDIPGLPFPRLSYPSSPLIGTQI